MGQSNSKYNIFLSYYLFQKEIKKNLLNKNKEDNSKYQKGYFIHPDWVTHWKKIYNYEIVKNLFNNLNVQNDNLDKQQISYIEENMKKNNISIDTDSTLLIISHNYLPLTDLITQKSLENLFDKKTFSQFKINKNTTIENIEYIFKKQMIILCFEQYLTIRVLIHSLEPFKKINNLINLRIVSFNENIYERFKNNYKSQNSKKILEKFILLNIFESPCYTAYDYFYQECFKIINEEGNIIQYDEKSQLFTTKLSPNINNNNIDNKIQSPQHINFDLAKRTSFRGLDNVGATCYMNATLQCLANIKALTDYLLNKDNYLLLSQNVDICKLTLKYAQVLIGLFCNEKITGSYCPEDFKQTISDLNPLFRGVKANDSKDLIIFLLEIFNNELVKIYKKKKNIKENENENTPMINIYDEINVFQNFRKNFGVNYHSIIGDNLCGFQKSFFICQNCGKQAFNFNIFNFLIFSLEATSNYFNLSQNNTRIPTITFEDCFKFLKKEEMFEDTYCQNCKQTGNSRYQENIYLLPNYLIIVLNRGKGNIFNCNVEIKENFAPTKYVVNEKECILELIGMISHFGESEMGDHFIAFCKHFMDRKWRIYNDSTVTECPKDYLKNGIPYILFYKKIKKYNNNNENDKFMNYGNENFLNNNNINNNMNFINNNMNFINNNMNFINNNMNFMNNIQNNNNFNFMNNFNNLNNMNNMNRNNF